MNLEKLNENEFLQDASRQTETGRTRTDFVMKEEKGNKRERERESWIFFFPRH